LSASDFDQFTEALQGNVPSGAAAGNSAVTANANRLDRITVLGGGADARQLAALCCAAEAEVTLFSAYGSELESIRSAGGITLRGDGPIGTFQVDQNNRHSITTTAQLDHAVDSAELIFLTGPVHKQRTYAMVLADHIRNDQCLVVAPARSFAALETASLLKVAGRSDAVAIVELSSLPFAASSQGSTLNLIQHRGSRAAIHNGAVSTLDSLGQLLGPLEKQQSVLHSSFADGSGLVQSVALMMGGPACPDGQPAIAMGGQPLAENNTLRNLLGDNHHDLLIGLAKERQAVAAQFGIRTLPGLSDWLDEYAGSDSGAGSRPVPAVDEARASLRCAVTGSLVPLQSAAAIGGTSVPLTDSLVTLASAILKADLRSAGRKLPAFGVDAGSLEAARRSLNGLLQANGNG